MPLPPGVVNGPPRPGFPPPPHIRNHPPPPGIAPLSKEEFYREKERLRKQVEKKEDPIKYVSVLLP